MAKKSQKQIDRDEQLYQLITLVAGSFTLQEVLDKLAAAAVRMVGVKACSIRLLDEDSGDLAMRSTYGLSEEYRSKGPVTKEDPVVKAAFAGEAVVLDDMRLDDRVKYKQATVREGLVSQLTVAMKFRGKAIGVLRLYSPRPKQFDEDDIVFARAVASHCAVAITNARLYAEAIEGARIAEQMRLAGIIQRRMIPQEPPRIAGLDIAATYIPCFEVGGDHYSFFPVSQTQIVVSISDVIGKGLPAAMMMSCFRGAVQAYTESGHGKEQNTKEIIIRLNRMACSECRDGEFISFFYGLVDSGRREITYCNCGHEPTLLMRAGQTSDLEKGGLVLGVDPEAEYEIGTVSLNAGDCLLFYTDGLIDTADFEGRLWGRERMIEAAQKSMDGPAERMLNSILGYRRRFMGLASQCDDTSIIVVKIE